MLGDLVPRPQEEKPLRTIIGLGRLMAAVHQAALVLCVDQLEEMVQQSAAEQKPGELFRRAVDALLAVAEEVPTAVIVVACLEDYYATVSGFLARPKLDRLAHDPEPMHLSSHRGAEEITALLARRLEVLYDGAGVGTDPANPVFPYNAAHVQKLGGMRTRDILDCVRRHHEACVQARRWLKFPETGDEASKGEGEKKKEEEKRVSPHEQRWNDFLAGFKAPSLEEEAGLAALLAWSVQTASAEMPDGIHFETEVDGRMVPVEAHGPGNDVEKLLAAVCDKDPRGNGLRNQVEEVAQRR